MTQAKLNLKDTYIYFDMDGTANEWDENGNPKAKSYFLTRPVIPSTIQAIQLLHDLGINVAFATSTYTTGSAMYEKRVWANRVGCEKIPVIFIPYGENKSDYLTGKVKILLDDHTPNLLKFDGCGIKFVNQINHKNGVWQGASVNYRMSGVEIAMYLLEQALKLS